MSDNDLRHESSVEVLNSHKEHLAATRRLAGVMLKKLESDVNNGSENHKEWGEKETLVSALTKLSQILIKSIVIEREMLGLDKIKSLEDEEGDEELTSPEDIEIVRMYELSRQAEEKEANE